MKKQVLCPHCHKPYSRYLNPTPTTDVVIYHPERGIVIIKRKNEPLGYALPGGFIDDGEQAENAAVREMLEETGLDVELKGLLGVYSKPDRDPRQHTLSVVFVGEAKNPDAIHGGDDAATARFYQLDELPKPLAFDHAKIIEDFENYLRGTRQLGGIQPFTE